MRIIGTTTASRPPSLKPPFDPSGARANEA